MRNEQLDIIQWSIITLGLLLTPQAFEIYARIKQFISRGLSGQR